MPMVNTEEKEGATTPIEGEFKETPPAEIPPERAVEVMTSAHGLALIDDPEKVIENARKAARAIVDVIKTKKKPVVLNGEQYLEVDDWTLLGQMYGVAAKVREESIERVVYGEIHGWKCYADVIDLSTGGIVGGGSGLCMTDEPEWKERASYKWFTEKQALEKGYTSAQFLVRQPSKWNKSEISVKILESMEPVSENARRSMAQTRSVSRALAIRLRFIPMLAGVKATPAEEMPRRGNDGPYGEVFEDNPPADAAKAPAAPVAPQADAAKPKEAMSTADVVLIKNRVKLVGDETKIGNTVAAKTFAEWNDWLKKLPGQNAAECYASLWANAEYTYGAKKILGIGAADVKPAQPVAAPAPVTQEMANKWSPEHQKAVRETVKSIQKFKKEGGNEKAAAALAEFGAFMDKFNLDWTGQNGRTSIWTRSDLRPEVVRILGLGDMLDDPKVPDPNLPFDPEAVPE